MPKVLPQLHQEKHQIHRSLSELTSTMCRAGLMGTILLPPPPQQHQQQHQQQQQQQEAVVVVSTPHGNDPDTTKTIRDTDRHDHAPPQRQHRHRRAVGSSDSGSLDSRRRP